MSSNLKKDQNRKKELAYMRMVKQTMQPKSDDERQKELAAEQAARPQTTGAKTSNFLYYYKWRIFVIALAVIGGAFLIFNLATKPKFDMNILTLYASGVIDKEALTGKLAQYGIDTDKNGQVILDIVDVDLGDTGNSTQRPKMISYINDSGTLLYLVDEGSYQELVGQEPDMFVDLSKLFPDSPNVDGQRLLLGGTQVGEEIGVKNMPGNFAFVLRTEDHAGKSAGDKERYQTALDMLENVINGTKTASGE